MIPIPEGCTIEPITGGFWKVLSTPFLDPSNDFIQIYVKEDPLHPGVFVLTDDEDAANYLFMHGIDDEKKIRPVMELIARVSPNITCNFPDLEARCELDDFIKTYHYLVGCILQVESAVLWLA